MLARPELEQLAQRVIARYHLDALSEAETAQYIRHRLDGGRPERARCRSTATRCKRIYELLARRAAPHQPAVRPRAARRLCERQASVDSQSVDKAAREVFDQPDFSAARRPKIERLATLGLGVAAGAVLVGAVAFALDRGERGVPTAASVAGTISSATSPPSSPTPAAPADPPPSAVGEPTPFDLASGFATLAGAEKDAWRELAKAWSVNAPEGDPCQAPRQQQVHCFRSANSTLALIRQLDRPVILTLRDGSNRPAYAYLSGLSGQNATLRVGGVPKSVSLVSLADFWRGEFATYWRVPPDYAGTITDSKGPTARWLALQLATARGDPRPIAGRLDDASLKAGVHAFQLTQGLPSDGVAGPITLMKLNRVIGIDEPHLQGDKQQAEK